MAWFDAYEHAVQQQGKRASGPPNPVFLAAAQRLAAARQEPRPISPEFKAALERAAARQATQWETPPDPFDLAASAPPTRPLIAEIATALRGLAEGIRDAFLGDRGQR
ncbi:hypothetical protein ACIBG0_38870 [Nocardia sp. NPDC050630]|uniref:hypothetical protein n=1 Tax=Nocardia sp. NPDC050630 TaxID=3364321 RepID=UPI0037A796BF